MDLGVLPDGLEVLFELGSFGVVSAEFFPKCKRHSQRLIVFGGWWSVDSTRSQQHQEDQASHSHCAIS